jgi:hypothetical protein
MLAPGKVCDNARGTLLWQLTHSIEEDATFAIKIAAVITCRMLSISTRELIPFNAMVQDGKGIAYYYLGFPQDTY